MRVGIVGIIPMWFQSESLGRSGNGVAIHQGFYLPVTEYIRLYIISVRNTLIYLLEIISRQFYFIVLYYL